MELEGITRRRLLGYVRHCKDLVRDVTHALNDRKLREQNWTMHYAVDFSELYAYVLPQETHESWSFVGLDALTEEEKLRQYRVLARFFNNDKILLPQPYALELQSFYDRVRMNSIDMIVKEASLALKEIEEIRNHPDAQRMLATSADGTPVQIDGESRKRFVKYLEENASYLRAFQRGVAGQPWQRLKALLSRRALTDLATVEAIDVDGNDPLVRQRHEALTKLRGQRYSNPNQVHSASFLDAVALELLRRTNVSLAKKKQRIMLLSRSRHLFRVVEDEARGRLWDNIGEIVRHPRTFDPIVHPPAGWSHAHELDLQRRRDNLHLFVRVASAAMKSAEKPTTSDARGDDGYGEDDLIKEQGLRDMLDMILNEWSVGDNLASALEQDTSSPVDADSIESQLLALIARPDLLQLVTTRIAEVFADLNHKHEDLGFELQHRAASRASNGTLVHRFRFDNQELDELAKHAARDWRTSVHESAAIFHAADHAERNSERLFAIALSLGALGRWDAAKDYIESAISEADIEGTPKRELNLFLAVSLGAAQPSLAKLKAAVESIDKALEEDADDPRFLKEKAAILLRWHRLLSQPGGDDYMDETSPKPETIEQLLYAALERATDLKLLAQIHNNLCYLYISPQTENFERAREQLAALEQVLNEGFPDSETWPVLMQDTILLAKFRLQREERSIVELRAWADMLTNLSKNQQLSDHDSRRLQRHAEEIREVIRQRQTSAFEAGLP